MNPSIALLAGCPVASEEAVAVARPATFVLFGATVTVTVSVLDSEPSLTVKAKVSVVAAAGTMKVGVAVVAPEIVTLALPAV